MASNSTASGPFPITLHEYSDVTLIIGPAKQHVHGSVSILRRASPVWRAMFNDRWAESESKEISLPDDDPTAMLTVLRIAHLQFADIPKRNEMKFRQLVNLSIICDKYDLVAIVRPFLDLYRWAKDLEYLYRHNGHEEWLFIAWTFGYFDIFSALARQIVFRVRETCGKGRSLGKGVVLGEHIHAPPGMIENIVALRDNVITTIITECRQIMEDALAVKVCSGTNLPSYVKTMSSDVTTFDPGPPDSHSKRCRSTITGSLIQAFHDLGIYPLCPPVAEYQKSLTDLIKDLKEVNVHHYIEVVVQKSSPYGYSKSVEIRSHRICAKSIDLSAMIDKIIAAIPSTVAVTHRNHIAEQARK